MASDFEPAAETTEDGDDTGTTAAGAPSNGAPPAAGEPDSRAPVETRSARPADVASPEAEAEGSASAPVDGDEMAVEDAEAAVVGDLAMLEKERDEFRALAQRIQADFENFKKQTVRRQTDLLERAGEELIGKLLPVLDTADLAVSHDDNESLLQLASALYDALQKEGLERIDPEGQPFDPTQHDAVMHEPGDGGDPQVLEVLRAGYRWKGRLVRPAMVKVKG